MYGPRETSSGRAPSVSEKRMACRVHELSPKTPMEHTEQPSSGSDNHKLGAVIAGGLGNITAALHDHSS